MQDLQRNEDSCLHPERLPRQEARREKKGQTEVIMINFYMRNLY